MIQKHVIPVWIWLIVLILFVLILGGSFLIPRERQNRVIDWKLDRLEHLGSHGVIAIGTSLTKTGFYFDSDMNTFAKKNGLDIHFVRCSVSGGKPNEFEQILDRLLISKPRYIFIQLEPFMVDSEVVYPRFNLLVHNIVNKLIRNIRFYTGKELTLATERQDDGDLGFKMEKHATPADIETAAITITKHPRLSKKYIRFLKKTHDRNIQVIFLQMNRSKLAYERTLPKNLKVLIHHEIAYLKSTFGVRVWSFSPLETQFYMDRAHLNRLGREVFSTWFIDALKKDGLDNE